MKWRDQLLQEEGFSLVEVLLSIGLLFFISIASVPLLLNSMERIMISGDKSRITYDAQREIEEQSWTSTHNVLQIDFNGDVVVQVENVAKNEARVVHQAYGKEINTSLLYYTAHTMSFSDFLVQENVFVYGTALHFQGTQVNGPGATVMIQDGSLLTGDLGGGNSINVTNIYIDGEVNLSGGSASLGSASIPGEIHIKGDLSLGNGKRDIYGQVFVDGDFFLKDAIVHHTVYVDGDLTLGYTPWTDGDGVDQAPDARIYYTGSLHHPYLTSDYDWILDKCIGPGDATFPHPFPVVQVLTPVLPSLKADSWYIENGYRTDDPPLSNGIKIFSDNYTGSHNAQDVIIVSKSDITITGWRTLSGIFYAPYGRVTFHQGNFEGLIIARDGFYYTGGGGSVTFRNLEDYIADAAAYPF